MKLQDPSIYDFKDFGGVLQGLALERKYRPKANTATLNLSKDGDIKMGIYWTWSPTIVDVVKKTKIKRVVRNGPTLSFAKPLT